MQRNKSKIGFTMIEILVSITIIGMLASISAVSYGNIRAKAQGEIAKSDLINASVALSSDLSKTGKYPDSLALANGGKGVAASEDITLNYTYDASRNAYMIVATYSNGKTYYITSINKTPTPGPAPLGNSLVATWGAGGADLANRVIKTSDGGFAITGSVTDQTASRTDMFISKYSASGNLTWTKSWGNPWGSVGKSLAETSYGAIEVFGDTDSYMFINQYLSNGALDVEAVITQDESYDYFTTAGMALQDDYNYITAANTSSPGRDGFIVGQIEVDGTPTWAGQYGNIGNQNVVSDVVINNDGGYTLVGSAYNSISTSRDAVIVKYDSSNNILWSQSVGGSGTETASTVVQTSDNGYMMVGTTNSFGTGNDAFIAKFTPSGLVSWTRTWGGAGNDYGNSITRTSDNGYVIAGSTTSFGANSAFIAKFDTSGTFAWNRTWGELGNSGANSVTQINNGSYVLTGYTTGYGNGGSDVLLAMYAPDGTISGCSTAVCKTPSATVRTSLISSLDESYIIYDSAGSFSSQLTAAYIERVAPSVSTKTLVAPWQVQKY